MAKEQDFSARVDAAILRVETIVQDTNLASTVVAIRHIAELKTLAREFTDGEVIARVALCAIEVLLDSLEES